MKNSMKLVAAIVVLVIAACAAWFALRTPVAEVKPAEVQVETPKKKQIEDVSRQGTSVKAGASEEKDPEPDDPKTEKSSDGGDDEESEEDKREDMEEALVEAFDNLTDKFTDVEEGKELSMDDVKRFHDQFKRIPEARKEECLHRALNLLPDENVMLLAGILMDKEEKKDLVELVFNDILNRDESVKKILLNEIYKDKTHPCWADTAWILDVTGKDDK